MISLRDLRITFTTEDAHATFDACLASGIAQRDPLGTFHPVPSDCSTPLMRDSADLNAVRAEIGTGRVGASWRGRHLNLPEPHKWWTGRISSSVKTWVKLINTETSFSIRTLLELLRAVPFTIAGIADPFSRGWPDDHNGETWLQMAAGHYPQGIACAFKGRAGHRRLVHRRWLSHGPWRWIYDPEHDLSLVQFHALDADLDTAVAQAWPGHLLMGVHDRGGLIPPGIMRTVFDPSLYDKASYTSVVVVAGERQVSDLEMLEAAGLRSGAMEGGPQVDQVAFVFMDEANARAHLPAMWARGFEVRAITDTGEVRLDDSYVPTPRPAPDWVAAEAAADGLGVHSWTPDDDLR
ncbi:MAG: hypothetical protein Tsb0020_31050 [Haliangiales bacterium]